MIFFDSAHAATTNLKLNEEMSMWDGFRRLWTSLQWSPDNGFI